MKNKELIRVERNIEINKKDTNELVEEISIDYIPLEKLLDIFTPYERGDSHLYDPYDISEEQMARLNGYLMKTISYDNEKCTYTLVAFGIYIDTVTGKILK